jgi:hypothetical protein
MSGPAPAAISVAKHLVRQDSSNRPELVFRESQRFDRGSVRSEVRSGRDDGEGSLHVARFRLPRLVQSGQQEQHALVG